MRKVYILPIRELKEPECFRLAAARVDSERLEKSKKYRMEADRIRSIGAGLLIQYALVEEKRGSLEVPGDTTRWETVEVPSILADIAFPVPIRYRYGLQGKPFFIEEDSRLYFSLSHSGNYVLCAVSHLDIGADIQEWEKIDNLEQLAKRFYTTAEQTELAAAPLDARERLFYRLWVRKEAYSKLTGLGIPDGIKADVRKSTTNIEWEEYHQFSGYEAAICYNRDDFGKKRILRCENC